jgi:hypothetical protein
MLLTQKALTEGCRALAMLYAQQMDVEKYTSDERHVDAKKVIAFLTPICKGFMTDMATEVTNIGIQVYGGHGYVREWGMEQLVRDTRIAQLYEGTNGIQAADLIGRKLTRDGGDMQQATFNLLSSRIAAMTDSVRQAQAVTLLQDWDVTSKALLGTNAVDIAGAATDYLHYSAYSLLGVLWLDMASAAQHSSNELIAKGKSNTCNFYIKRLLPRKDIHRSVVLAAADDLMAVEDQQFDYV